MENTLVGVAGAWHPSTNQKQDSCFVNCILRNYVAPEELGRSPDL